MRAYLNILPSRGQGPERSAAIDCSHDLKGELYCRDVATCSLCRRPVGDHLFSTGYLCIVNFSSPYSSTEVQNYT